MGVKLQRPLLIGGVGLSFGLWALQSLHDSATQLSEFGVIGVMALGAGFWLFQKQTAKDFKPPEPLSLLDREKVEKAIAETECVITQLEAEAEPEANAQLRERLAQLSAELDRRELHLVITGGKMVGKTTLLKVLQSSWVAQQPRKLDLRETLPLFTATSAETTFQELVTSDLVLFVTNGDLTDPEFQTLQQLTTVQQRTVLIFNKQDQYLPEERAMILQQLRQRMRETLSAENVVAVATAPNPIKVRQHQPDNSIQEWMEQPAPDLASLTPQLSKVIAQEGQQLIWATTFRTAVALKAEAKTLLNGVRRERALPVIEQYQWIAAAAAFANPVPALDLLATAAINAQLVMELGAMYQQKFSLEQAQTAAGTLGSLMLKLGLVELSTQTIGTLLKGNAVTFVAGGLVQGVSAAYLTRLAGLSLIEYFQAQETAAATGSLLNLDQLGQTLQRVFQQNQRGAFLQSFVKQTVARLSPSSPAEISLSETAVIPTLAE